MSVAKLASGGTLNAMKSSEISKATDTHLPLFQLLNAFDHPDMSGWPFLTPVKAPMVKCEKCSREFTSSINHRRHSRVHRRPFHVNKEYNKNRELLAAFWDKLPLEEAERVVSCDDVMLKELPGSTIIMALASSLRKPGVWSLPQAYVKAGSALLDIFHAKPSGLPISSNELFNVLDDASERTFLCAGTADAVEKYVLDGGDSKQCLELKNLVAATSFLFERQLVNAWLADKEAEALRCHELLVEEEEAAQKRQAELIERKRRKRLRQKEQKAKEQLNRRNGDLNVEIDSAKESTPPPTFSDSTSDSADLSENVDLSPESTRSQTKEPNEDTEAQLDLGNEHINPVDSQITDLHMVSANEHQRSMAIPPQASRRNGFHANHKVPVLKQEPANKLGSFKNPAVAHKVWTKKLKANMDRESLSSPSSHEHASHLVEEDKCDSSHEDASHLVEEDNCKVMIGSIPVPLRAGLVQQQIQISQKPNQALNANNVQSGSGANQVPSKLWRPVIVKEVSGEDLMLDTVQGGILSDEGSPPQPQSTSNICNFLHGKDTTIVPGYENAGKNLPFSNAAAREFLERRWKEVISSDHVVLTLSPSSEAHN